MPYKPLSSPSSLPSLGSAYTPLSAGSGGYRPLSGGRDAEEEEKERKRKMRERIAAMKEAGDRQAERLGLPNEDDSDGDSFLGAMWDKAKSTSKSGASSLGRLVANQFDPLKGARDPLAAKTIAAASGGPTEEDVQRVIDKGQIGEAIPPLSRLDDRLQAEDVASRDRLAQAAVDSDIPDPVAAAGFWAAETGGMLASPEEALPGGLVARGLSRGGRAVRKAVDFSDIAKGVDEGLVKGAAEGVEAEAAPLSRSLTETVRGQESAAAAREAAEAAARRAQVDEAASALADDSLPPDIDLTLNAHHQRAQALRKKFIELRETDPYEAHAALARASQIKQRMQMLTARGRAAVDQRHREAAEVLAAADPEDLVNSPGTVDLLKKQLGLEAAEGGAGAADDGIEELARLSQGIGSSPPSSAKVARTLDVTPGRPQEGSLKGAGSKGDPSPVRLLSAVDEGGEEIGTMTFSIEDDGFRVMDASTGARGTGGLRSMMRKAQEISGGPYRGSFAESDEGAAALSRLRETDPDLFPRTPDTAPAGQSAVDTLTGPTRGLTSETADAARKLNRAPGEVTSPLARAQEAGSTVVRQSEEAFSSVPDRPNAEPRPLPATRSAPRGLAKAWSWVRDNFTSFGEFNTPSRTFVDPEPQAFIRSVLPRRIAQQAAEERTILQQMARERVKVDRALRDEARTRAAQIPAAERRGSLRHATSRIEAELRRDLNRARRSGDLTSLPDPLQAVAKSSGDFIDDLTRRFIDEGVVTGEESIALYKDNLGKYLHTSYAAFDVDNFKDIAVGNRKTFNRAFRFLKEQMDDASDEEVLGVMYQLVDRDTGEIPFRLGGKIPSKDLREKMRRGDIPPEIQDLMGVYDDFVVNFEKSGALMAHDLTVHRMLTDVAEEGQRLGVFQVKPRGDFYKAIPGHENKTPLAGLHTTSEVAALLSATEVQSKPGLYLMLNGLVKWGKVGISPQTQVRNWESGLFMSLANGRTFASRSGLRALGESTQVASSVVAGSTESRAFTAANRVLRFLGEESDDALAAGIDRATDLGVLGTGANTGEFISYGQQIGRAFDPSKGGKVKRGAAAANEAAVRAYRTGDDFWKYYNWKEEVKELTWAYRGAGEGAAIPSRAAIEAEAAEVVQQQLQTYERTAPIARKLSRNPLVGAFATFQFEMPRNLKNIALRAAKEARLAKETGNPRFAALAAKRVVGIGAATTVWGGINAWTAGQLGITGEMEEAFRSLGLPEWADNSQPVFISREGTKVEYIDSQYQDPYSVVSRAWTSLVTRPGDLEERALRFAGEMAETYLGEEPLAVSLIELAANKELRNQGKVYSESDPLGERLKDQAYHLYRGAAPGGVGTGERIARGAGLLNPYRPGGREYELGDELQALGGLRVVNTDVADSFGFKARDWGDRRTEIVTDFNDRMRRARTPKDRLEAQRVAEAAWKRYWVEMQDHIDNARAWEVPRGRVTGALKTSGVNSKLRDAILSGGYIPFHRRLARPPQSPPPARTNP